MEFTSYEIFQIKALIWAIALGVHSTIFALLSIWSGLKPTVTHNDRIDSILYGNNIVDLPFVCSIIASALAGMEMWHVIFWVAPTAFLIFTWKVFWG